MRGHAPIRKSGFGDVSFALLLGAPVSSFQQQLFPLTVELHVRLRPLGCRHARAWESCTIECALPLGLKTVELTLLVHLLLLFQRLEPRKRVAYLRDGRRADRHHQQGRKGNAHTPYIACNALIVRGAIGRMPVRGACCYSDGCALDGTSDLRPFIDSCLQTVDE